MLDQKDNWTTRQTKPRFQGRRKVSFDPLLAKHPSVHGLSSFYRLVVNGECIEQWEVRHQQDFDDMLRDWRQMGIDR